MLFDSADVRAALSTAARLKDEMAANQADLIVAIAEAVAESLQRGGKLLVCGNGGSAADAQHIAGELLCRLRVNRQPLPAVALTTDTSVLTAIANDLAYEDVFSRQMQALAKKEDVALLLTTSGRSPNVLAALATARRAGACTIVFTGRSGAALTDSADYCLCVPSEDPARIQELHIAVAHIVCELVEREVAAPVSVGAQNEARSSLSL